MSESQLIERIDQLTEAVKLLAQTQGARLTRAEVINRLRVHRNTLPKLMAEGRFPKPGTDGKWLLSEVLEWEARKA